MAAESRVVVIGDALIDELRDDSGVREFVGGAALNVAVGLSRLGVPTSLIAMVGDDEPGERIRGFLADYGVELIASASPHGTSRAVSTRSAGGEPTYVFNTAAQQRRVVYGAAERAAIAAAPLVAISCVPFDDRAQTDELIDAVAAASVVAIDPNPRAGMLHDRDEFVRGFERAAAGATLVKVGDDDAELLYGISLDALTDRLVGLGVGAVLATRGSAGARIVAGDADVSLPVSALPGRIVDTMGAGDAVLASVAASVIEGRPESGDAWRAVLQRAMDVAAATCRVEGALLRLPESLGGIDLDRIGT